MNDHEFEQHLQQLLRQHGDDIDAKTLSRLRQARQQALQQLDTKPEKRWSNWVPAGALASLVILSSALLLNTHQGQLPGPKTGADELEIMAAEDNLELYQNLEFYIWLAEEEQHAG